MILLFITGISLLQLFLYYLNDKYKTKLSNFIILLIILIGYLFVFPQFFYPEPRKDGINCGMPILAITLAFWIFGTFAGVTTHLIWKIKKAIMFKFNSTDL